jgi:hypothetical protein
VPTRRRSESGMGSRVRTWAAAVLGVLGCLLALVSVVTVWGRDQVLDTDRYVATVGPLASDPVVQDDVAARVTTAIDARLDLDRLARRHLPSALAPVGVPLGSALRRVVSDQTTRFVRSEAFAELWVTVNRAAHSRVVAALTGQGPDVVAVDHGRITLDLTPVVAAVRQRLAALGLPVALLPTTRLVVDLADAGSLVRAQHAVRRLDALALWLPVATVVLLVGAVALARRRLRASWRLLAGLAVTMVLLVLAVRLGAGVVVRHVSADVAGRDVVHAYYRGLTRTLARSGLVVAVVAAVAAAVVAAVGRVPRLR